MLGTRSIKYFFGVRNVFSYPVNYLLNPIEYFIKKGKDVLSVKDNIESTAIIIINISINFYNVSDLMGLRKKIICHNYDLRSPQKQV